MEERIVVLGADAGISAAFTGLAVSFAEEPGAVGTECKCAVVSEKLADAACISALKHRGIAVTAVTCSTDPAVQDRLLENGAEDVLVLPIGRKLLQKRLSALAEMPLRTAEPFDFAAFDRISEAKEGRGAFLVEEHDFKNVYRFVSRILERLEKKAQMVVFTFQSPCGPIAETEDMENFMRIGQACLRRGDISAICGTQVLLLLLGADDADCSRIVKRLTDTFSAHYCDATSRITYEIREING